MNFPSCERNMKKSSLQRDLVDIASNFANIYFISIEKRGETLVNNLNVFKNATACITKAPGDVSKYMTAKCVSKNDLET